jgi:hypothetical protein
MDVEVVTCADCGKGWRSVLDVVGYDSAKCGRRARLVKRGGGTPHVITSTDENSG